MVGEGEQLFMFDRAVEMNHNPERWLVKVEKSMQDTIIK